MTATTKPPPWIEHGKPVTRTFAKVSVAAAVDPKSRTGAPPMHTTIAVSPQGWQDPELVKLLANGGQVTRAWVVRWASGYPVREVGDERERVCKHCWRPIFYDPGLTGAHEYEDWNLVYREYEQTRKCDARSDGATLSQLPHEPWSAE